MREDCHTCHQGGSTDKKEDCFRRNILYESRCGTCEDRELQRGQAEEGKSRKKREDFTARNIYVGETSRSLYERIKEHIKDGIERAEDSHIAKHWDQDHMGEQMPHFRFKIVRSFKDSLSRQVAESVRIDLRGEGVLNSKSVYSRNTLPRLEIQKTEWEKADEERKKRAEECRQREEQREREKSDLGEGQTVADEWLLAEAWRQNQLKSMDREEQELDNRPKKKMRVMDTQWGQKEQTN